MEKIKREIGEVWKEGRNWMVQFPKGKMPFKTKKAATLFSESFEDIEALKKQSQKLAELQFREQYQAVCHQPDGKQHLVLNKNGGRYYSTIDNAKASIEKDKQTKLRGFTTSCNGIGISVEVDSDYIKMRKAETYSIEKRYITEWEEIESNV